MKQEEVDEVQRLAREAVRIEQLVAAKKAAWASEASSEAWRELMVYIMHIAADRASMAVRQYEEDTL